MDRGPLPIRGFFGMRITLVKPPGKNPEIANNDIVTKGIL